MKAEPISIATSGIPLDGLFYEARGATKGAVLLMHGSTMNFYVGPPRFLPPRLTKAGFACLAFNRRGHDMLTTFDSRDPHGAAYQTVAQGVEDNEIAADWLKQRGFPHPIAIGHSLGAALAVRFAVDNPATPALVAMSSPRGGPDHMERGAAAGMFGAHEHETLAKRALQLVDEGRGLELMRVPGWPYVISARHYADNMRNFPSILELAAQLRCPTLCVAGAEEPPEATPTAAFAEACRAPCEHALIPDTGHFYVGKEEMTAELVCDWLVRTIG